MEKNYETRRNAEAAETEDIEEEMDRRAASPVPTLSRRHRSKISDRMRSRSPCSEGSATSQSESESESEGSGSEPSGGKSRKKKVRGKKRGRAGSSPELSPIPQPEGRYMQPGPGFETIEQPISFEEWHDDEDENDQMSETDND